MSVKNSLSTILGSYMSDSENEYEDNPASNSYSKEIGNLIDEIDGKKAQKQELPQTDWTQCMDINTGHPYYWNIVTKEVTWEKPEPYETFLKQMKTALKKIPSDSWVIGHAEGSETPYYMNVFTREISWRKPDNFKEKKKSKKPKKRKPNVLEEKLGIELKKKKYPKHLEAGSDDEVKIKLIDSFSNKSGSSSEDDEKRKTTNKQESKLKTDTLKPAKINLVAAYVTDDEEEVLETLKPQNNASKSNMGSPESSQTSQKSIKSDKPQITSFASIITGGKIDDEIDEEIIKLKEELEIDVVKQKDDEIIESEKCAIIPIDNVDNSFDEKNFKRKRRIEFGTSAKFNAQVAEAENEDSKPSFVSANSDETRESTCKETSNPEKLLAKKNLYSNFKRSHIAFSKSEETNIDDSLAQDSEKMNLNHEITDLSDIILGKVKFLSVGHSEVSTVQAMRIQLETLLAAFKSSSLSSEYFFKWLKQTSDDLSKLEGNAAPEGWICKWDRSTAQYCYENVTTNEVMWEFPTKESSQHEGGGGGSVDLNPKVCAVDELACNTNSNVDTNDEEVNNILKEDNKSEEQSIAKPSDENKGEVIEMDISTTPPPNENERIIVEHNWDADNAPPPPRITTPSPPVAGQSLIINDELSAFYSDIAKITNENIEQCDATTSNSNDADAILTNSSNKITSTSEGNEQAQQQQLLEKKKRKKAKVSGLTMGDKGVSEMVAKWQKAQQQKGYNFW